MNKKGLTIIELLIAIALISIVIVFLYRLLNSVNSDLNDNNYAINNQTNRFEIIRDFNLLLTRNKINEIKFYSSDNLYRITVSFDNTKTAILTLEIDNVVLEYDKEQTKWTMQDSELEIDPENISVCTSVVDNIAEVITIDIPVYTSNELNNVDNNNYIDDLSFIHYNVYNKVLEGEIVNAPSCKH